MLNIVFIINLFFEIKKDNSPLFEEFHRKTRYIHFGQFEIFEI